jgi:hypothetical protein
MERQSEASVRAYVEAMRGSFEAAMTQVMESVNQASAGQVIDASEEQVRDVLGAFRAKAYQTALQMRVNAAEAAFSPGGPGDGPTPVEQGSGGP